VGGYLAGAASDPSETSKVASAGPLSVELPSNWERRAAAQLPAGVRRDTALAAAPRGSNGPALVAWRAEGSSILPIGPPRSGQAADEPVRIGRFQAIRHRSSGPAGEVVTYSLPTDRGTAAVACHAPRGGSTAILASCERVVSTLRLSGMHPISLQAVAAEDGRIAATLQALSERRSADRAILAGAQTPGGQSFRAQQIQIDFRDARRSLEGTAAGHGLPSRRGLIAALRQAESAYGALVAAVEERSTPEYDAARRQVDRAEAALARLLAGPAG
jgi:hypothetical protein